MNVAACVSSDPEGIMSALRALATSVANAVPGVRSVTHTAVAAEPELRRAPEAVSYTHLTLPTILLE